MKFVFSPDVILCAWLGSKHERTEVSLGPMMLLRLRFIVVVAEHT